jgi:16S rRNA (guanine527-N7)-methyltransferase
VPCIQEEAKGSPLSIIDVGTGGGFPLLPLALALPSIRFLGIDATRKKTDAVERIRIACDIANATLTCGRVEERAHEESLRATFDIVTARAVAELAPLLELTAPFARTGGLIILWKSMTIADELTRAATAFRLLGARMERAISYTLPEGFGSRQLLLIRKLSATPKEYPRGVGIPKKSPLGASRDS